MKTLLLPWINGDTIEVILHETGINPREEFFITEKIDMIFFSSSIAFYKTCNFKNVKRIYIQLYRPEAYHNVHTIQHDSKYVAWTSNVIKTFSSKSEMIKNKLSN